jgi:hypothetical protein
MEWSSVSLGGIPEAMVIVFQVVGVGALGMARLLPSTPWSRHGRTVFVVSLVGLGIAGAICGHNDSEFGLFAGCTMTSLLIGMTVGSVPVERTGPAAERGSGELALAA